MNKTVQGTYRTEGLIEGTLVDAEQEAQIRQWTERCQTRGFTLHLTVEGNAFSLLADETPKSNPAPATPVDSSLRELLEELTSVCPARNAGELFSTLRSVEYQEGTALQTVYSIDHTGSLQVQQRAVPAQTVPATVRRSWRDRLPLIGGIAALVLVLFLVSLLFVPYGRVTDTLVRRLTPVKLETVSVQPGPFAEHISPNGLTRAPRSELVILQLKPAPSFPHTPKQTHVQWRQQSGAWGQANCVCDTVLVASKGSNRHPSSSKSPHLPGKQHQSAALIPTKSPCQRVTTSQRHNSPVPKALQGPFH